MSTTSETYKELTCARLSSDGAGVCFDEGRATFVTGLLPGESGLVTVSEVKRRWQRGRLVRLLEISPNRVTPPCRVFDECGGCQLQHLEYAETLRWKQLWVADALKRIGKINVPVNTTAGMEFPWRYRNKARLHKDQNGNLGYYRKGSNTTIVFPDCLLLSERMNGWIRELRGFLQEETEVSTVMMRTNSLDQGLVLLEAAENEERDAQVFSIDLPGVKKRELGKLGMPGGGEKTELRSNDLEEFLHTGVKSIWKWKLNSSQVACLIAGDAVIREKVLGLTFQASPTAFLQVNHTQMEILYSIVLEWADLSGHEQVWDLYCGVGTLTLALARRADHVLGIEANPQAITDAKLNAELNRITNARFRVGPVEKILLEIEERPDLVVVDPPRAGLHPAVVTAILNVKPPRLIYVSCDPGTLARDLALFDQGGYQISRVQPVDMFPWTLHVETIIMMTNCGKDKK